MGTEHSNQPPGAERPKRRMVLRKIAPDGAAQCAAPSLAPNEPTEKVRPRMPSASELPRIPRQAMAAEFAEMKRMAEVAQAGRRVSTTVRPPPPPDSDPGPIPLTRLHTPRPRFRSAIDFPAHASHGHAAAAVEEPRVHETSSTSLPPLVATLPPPAVPIYLPAGLSSGNRRRAMAMARSGALLLGALALVVGGVAMGRRLDQPQPATEAGRAGSATQKDGVVHVLGAGASAPYQQPVIEQQQQQPVPVVVAPASAPAAPPAIEATLAVEALPVAPSAAPARVAAAVLARPGLAPPASPRPAAPPATSAASTGAPIRSAEKDPSLSDDTATAGPPAATKEPLAAPHHEAADESSDPLVKAVRADIEEEEARRK